MNFQPTLFSPKVSALNFFSFNHKHFRANIYLEFTSALICLNSQIANMSGDYVMQSQIKREKLSFCQTLDIYFEIMHRSDEFFALNMKVQCIYYYSSPQKMWIHEKSILGVLGQKYLKFAIVPCANPPPPPLNFLLEAIVFK